MSSHPGGISHNRIPLAVRLYGVLTFILFLIASPAVLVGLLTSRERWRNSLGLVPVTPHGSPRKTRTIWVHASSVGEVRAATKLVRQICQDSNSEVVFSTMTPAGQWVARTCLEGPRAFFYLPLDVPFAVRRAIRAVDGDSLLLVETELWPLLICEAKRKGMKVVVVNGRLSDKAARRYAAFRPLFKHVLGSLDAVMAQSQKSARNFELLGTPRERISITGNTKQDAQEAVAAKLGVREKVGWSQVDLVLTAGSTRSDEESTICEGFASARGSIQNLRLVLAPRHLRRVQHVSRIVSSRALRLARWSQIRERGEAAPSGNACPDVLILDTIGDLAAVYRESDIAFVGGTLSGHGGHNVLEPASAGLVVLAGPSTENIEADSKALSERGALMRVGDSKQICEVLTSLARCRDERERRAREAMEFYRSRPVASTITFLGLRKVGVV